MVRIDARIVFIQRQGQYCKRFLRLYRSKLRIGNILPPGSAAGLAGLRYPGAVVNSRDLILHLRRETDAVDPKSLLESADGRANL